MANARDDGRCARACTRIMMSAVLVAACGDDADVQSAATDAAFGSTSDDDDATTADSSGDETGARIDRGEPDGVAFDEPMCALPPRTSGLELLGMGEGVHVGPDPALGLATFTLEAWVRWDGYGTPAISGADGVIAEPILAKGRGENDASNVDCNYFMGIDASGRLVADFEDMENGDNHPIASQVAIEPDRWTHVAATFDGARWRLFVDGALQADAIVDATPRFDSIQHFGIGSAYDSMGVPMGSFDGVLDDVRVWSRALSQAEIQSGIFGMPIDQAGLVAHFPLDDAPLVEEIVAGHHGQATGTRWVDGGPPRAVSTPPAEPLPVAPIDIAPPGPLTLTAKVFDLDDDPMRVEFWARPLPDVEPFSIVVLPDTQYYVASMNGGVPQMFYDQTQWVVENAEALQIRAVLHVGDLVEHRESFVSEWMTAETAMETLEGSLPGYPDGIPYGIAIGNHDQGGGAMPGMTMYYNQYFGVDRFEGKRWWGGHFGTKNDNSYITFTAGQLKLIAFFFEYDQEDTPEGNTGPDDDMLAWARGVLRAHPDHLGILASHSCLQGTETNPTVGTPMSAQGLARYQALMGEPNLRLSVCGHVRTEGRRTDVAASVVHTLLADYQFDGTGGSGKLRIMTFYPAEDRMEVQTYSPYFDQWYEGPDAHFFLDIDLDHGGGAFERIGAIDDVTGGEVSLPWPDAASGMRYEWYVTVTDCVHEVTGPRQIVEVG